MHSQRQIKNVLISVFYKDNLAPVIEALDKMSVTFYSTGGTREYIESLGKRVTAVEDITGYPSILGGRVKTLHPKIFGGILARKTREEDIKTLHQYEIPFFDLVVVDLYPFEETVMQGRSEEEITEKIDIGGISLIRAAAKNYREVLIISGRHQYDELLDILENDRGITVEATRKSFAREAFFTSYKYDNLIYRYFSGTFTSTGILEQTPAQNRITPLRYGENPHQKGFFKGDTDDVYKQLNGKEISYNNLLDIDAAVKLIAEFEEPTIAVLKHNNACGAASHEDMVTAWNLALSGDPLSAFGGVIVTNRMVTVDLARAMNTLFFEVLMAPDYEEEALQVLKQKGNRILLRMFPAELPKIQQRSLLNGIIEQDTDGLTEHRNQMIPVTTVVPTEKEFADLEFALKIAKHSKSNTIVLAKNKQLRGSGVGMTSRVDALHHAIHKAAEFSLDLQGAVMASDAFFPFPDCVEIAMKHGIKAIVQPGGSVKDQLSIDACNAGNTAMVFTGVRHFKH